jgi:uncharacterized protein (DUF1919 family)
VISWFQRFLSKFNLHRYTEEERAIISEEEVGFALLTTLFCSQNTLFTTLLMT